MDREITEKQIKWVINNLKETADSSNNEEGKAVVEECEDMLRSFIGMGTNKVSFIFSAVCPVLPIDELMFINNIISKVIKAKLGELYKHMEQN